MTFLLQKHYAIHRTQVRDSLRSFASGVALTGRLAAACLLLAGFLGVGSATAQAPPTILRLGGGDVALKLDDLTTDATNDYLDVHHFVIGTGDPVNNPSGIPSGGGAAVNTSFLIGTLALVAVDDVDNHKLTISPLATGSFKIALSPDGEAALTKGDDMTNVGQPHEFVIVSANAPMLTGKVPDNDNSYNQLAKDDRMDITLTPRDDTTHPAFDIIGLFTDPDDVTLTYSVKADTVGRGKADGSDGEAIVNATISSDNKLMISLTDKAKAQDSTDVWLTATDPSGEYARKRYYIGTGSPTNPYVKEGLDDVMIREDAANTDIDVIMLAGTADDPAFADEALEAAGTVLDPDTGTNIGDNLRALEISVAIGDKDATQVAGATDADFTWVTSYMNASVEGNGGEAPTMTIDPRAAGEVTFTVTATDRGPACPAEDSEGNPYKTIDKDNDDQTDLTVTGDDAAVKCYAEANSDTTVDADETMDLYKDSKTATTMFKVTIVSKTTPSVTNEVITLADLDSEKGAMGAMTINLDDLNGDKTGMPTAFNKHGQTLSYAVKLAKEKTKVGDQEIETDVAIASVEGSMVTVTPIWRAGDITVEATVTAMNGIAGETAERKFDVTVKSAKTPVVTQNDLVQLALANGFEVMRGDKMELDLRDLFEAGKDQPKVPLFIDPNADMDDALPGGLQLRIRPEDVVTAHLYEDQSSDNDIYTSMGRLMLDPKAAMLTFYATAPNTMTVTIHATDRERLTAMASTTIMVPEVPSAEAEELPTEVSLSQNYPNPFNPRTTIEYALPEAGDVSLIVYDMLGREVTTLLEGPQAAGRHTVNFDANHLSNGTYVYRLVAPNKTITRTMVLVK